MKEQKSNSYSRLFSNTIIFAIGAFSSKVLVFLLLPLYTRALTQEQYGSVDLIMQIANLLIPVITCSIADAVIRFGLDNSIKKPQIFSTAIIIVIFGATAFLLSMPLFSMISFVKGYGYLLFAYVLIASLKLVLSEFVRARKLVKLYAFNGLVTTVSMIAFNVLFLVVLKVGIIGYLLAIILSDAISILFLSFVAELPKYFRFRFFSKDIAKRMLFFSIPLIPTAIMWWVINVSDRFMINHYMGEAANGLYTISYKIPTIIATVYAIFNQAWNMSAITENNSKNRSRFYSKVFDSNVSVLFVVAAGALLMLIPMMKVLVAPSFFISYLYSPYLIIATVFNCFAAFLSSVYTATKRTSRSLVTSILGAVINISLNLILIPIYGINGASFATMIAYFIVFTVRIIDTRKLIPFRFLPGKIIINTVFLVFMALSLIFIKKYVAIPLIIGFIFVVLLNLQSLTKAAKAALPNSITRRIPFLK